MSNFTRNMITAFYYLWAEPVIPMNFEYDQQQHQGFYSQQPKETGALAQNEKDAAQYIDIVNRTYTITPLRNESRQGVKILGWAKAQNGWIFQCLKEKNTILQIYLVSTAQVWSQIKNLDKHLQIFCGLLSGMKKTFDNKIKDLDGKIQKTLLEMRDKKVVSNEKVKQDIVKKNITEDLSDFDLMYLFYKIKCCYKDPANINNVEEKSSCLEIQNHISFLLTGKQNEKNEKTRQQKGAEYFVLNNIVGSEHNNVLTNDLQESGQALYISLARALFHQYSQTVFVNKKINGAWGCNNCIFNSILWHPDVIKEIVEFFGKDQKLDPKDPRFMTQANLKDEQIKYASTDGGKILRQIVCDWIVKNKDERLIDRLTVTDAVSFIEEGLKDDAAIEYIKNLGNSTDFINEEILTVIAAKIDRPIIVVTKHPDINGILVPKIGGSLSGFKLKKKPIYICNNSESRSAAYSSGSHYDGLKEVETKVSYA